MGICLNVLSSLFPGKMFLSVVESNIQIYWSFKQSIVTT